MRLLRSVRRLWRHARFRWLLAVRVAVQAGDGVLQAALASYVLFSPERQPDAASIATVLAITLLPFSLLGPFVGVVLDRWSRRQILIAGALGRAALALGLAAIVLTGSRTGAAETAFYAVVLVAMSLNRFLLAALSAALPHTVDPDEYLVANSVVPTVGPAGALVGVGVGAGLRLGLGTVLPDYQANAVIFTIGALGFLAGAACALPIPRRALGPDDGTVRTRAREVFAGLAATLRHLHRRRAAGLGLATIAAQRLVYGVVTVAMILIYRNHFHAVTDIEPAIADLGLLVAATGAGFLLAALITPLAAGRWGVRRQMTACLAACAVLQVVPGSIIAKVWLTVAAFALGLAAQSLKICVDTLVQAHVDDEFKGRVFVIYDMIFNIALPVAAVVAAAVLPPDGVSIPVLVTLAGLYGLISVVFAVLARNLDLDAGTGSIRS